MATTFGMIGCGNVAGTIAESFEDAARATLVGCSDVVAEVRGGETNAAS